MTKSERITFLIQVLQEAAKNKLLHMENPYLLEACSLLGWHIYPPSYQWNFYHIINSAGGIILFDFNYLISKLICLKSTEDTME